MAIPQNSPPKGLNSGSRDKLVAISDQVRVLNLTGLVNKEVIENNWMVFPYFQRDQIFGTEGRIAITGVLGLAYKK